MAQKSIKLKMDAENIVVHGLTTISINIGDPKLNVGKLYESVFADIEKPTSVSVELDSSVSSNPKAREIANSIKTIIEEAVETINTELPLLIVKSDDSSEEIPDGEVKDSADSAVDMPS